MRSRPSRYNHGNDLYGLTWQISRQIDPQYAIHFVCYAYEPNAILVRPMKSRSDECFVAAYKEMYEYLESRGFKPKLNVTDNECSKAVQKYIDSQNVSWQLVEPDNHRVNAAERAIQTFKNHFLAGLASVDAGFPLQLWCYLLEQAEMTLNMLRTARSNNEISAYEALEGKFDYNKTPIAPPGTKALIYEAATRRKTWAPHAVNGWYLGPAMKHYRCGKYFIDHSRAIRIANTAKLFPSHCKIPTISEADRTVLAANELLQRIKSEHTLKCANDIKHKKIMQQLTDIIENRPAPRVDQDAPPRVPAPSTSVNITAPRVVRKIKQLHQRKTRQNNPIPAVIKNGNENELEQHNPSNRNGEVTNAEPRVVPIRTATSQRDNLHDFDTNNYPHLIVDDDTQPISTDVPSQRGRNVHIIEDVTTPLETQRVPPRRSPRLRMPQFHAANAAIFLNKEALHEVVANAIDGERSLIDAGQKLMLTLATNYAEPLNLMRAQIEHQEKLAKIREENGEAEVIALLTTQQ